MRIRYLIVCILFFSSCILITWDNRVVVSNTTPYSIAYDYELRKINDTVLYYKECDKMALSVILPDSSERISSLTNFDKSIRDSTVLMFWIYSTDTIAKYGLCTTLKLNKHLKIFKFTHEDLVKRDWNIIFDNNQ